METLSAEERIAVTLGNLVGNGIKLFLHQSVVIVLHTLHNACQYLVDIQLSPTNLLERNRIGRIASEQRLVDVDSDTTDGTLDVASA